MRSRKWKPIDTTSRDGLAIHGITLHASARLVAAPLARGRERARRPLASRHVGFPRCSSSPIAACRGPQVNFRGSTVTGAQVLEASFREWGRKMQDDVTDGVRWLIAQGIADPARAAIYGGSYGGYATLAGPRLHARRLRVRHRLRGRSSLMTFCEGDPALLEADAAHAAGDGRRHGRIEAMRAALPVFQRRTRSWRRSSSAQALGTLQVVKERATRWSIDRTQARCSEVEYIVKDNEGHGLPQRRNKVRVLRGDGEVPRPSPT